MNVVSFLRDATPLSQPLLGPPKMQSRLIQKWSSSKSAGVARAMAKVSPAKGWNTIAPKSGGCCVTKLHRMKP